MIYFLNIDISHVVDAYAYLDFEFLAVDQVSAMGKSTPSKSNKESNSTNNQKVKVVDRGSLQWTEKYRPKVPNDIVGNQSMVRNSTIWLCWSCTSMHTQLSMNNCSFPGSIDELLMYIG